MSVPHSELSEIFSDNSLKKRLSASLRTTACHPCHIVAAMLITFTIHQFIFSNPCLAFHPLASPDFNMPFGTDRLGRTMGIQLISGILGTLAITAATVTLSTLLGFSYGLMRALACQRARLNLRGFFHFTLIPVLPWIFWHLSDFSLFSFKVSEPFRLFGAMICLALAFALFTILNLRSEEHYRKKEKSFFSLALPMDFMIETVLALPSYVIALAIAIKWPPGLATVTAALSLSLWPYTGRLIYRSAIQTIQSDYYISAKACGYSEIQIFWYDLMPSVLPMARYSLLATAAMAIAGEAALGFLELGPIAGSHSTVTTLGTIAANCRHYPTAWWLTLFPGIAILILTALLNRSAKNVYRNLGVS